MSKKDEALKLALSVLDEVRSETFRLLRNGQKLYAEEKVWNAIFVIKQALAEQPAQQQVPVAWKDKTYGNLHHQDFGNSIPLYTSPPASKPWVGLTDEEVDECYYWKGRQWTTDELVRHVEAKLREKNA